MGNNSYQPQICINCQGWQSNQHGGLVIAHKNLSTNQKVQEYVVPPSSFASISNDKQIYEWRLKNGGRNNLIQVLQVNIPERKHSCCSYAPGKASIITEDIMKVDQIGRLDPFQVMNLINDWITGISHLYKQFGYFSVEQGMIGWNNRLIGKIWINSNYSVNTVHQKIECRSGFDYQRYAVRKIVELITQNYGRKEDYFINQLKQLQHYNFAATKEKLKKIVYAIQASQSTPTQPSQNDKCQPILSKRENNIITKNKEIPHLPLYKSPTHQHHPEYRFQYQNSQLHQRLSSKENVRILRPRIPTIIQFQTNKLRSKSCVGHNPQPISEVESNAYEQKQQFKLTTITSTNQNSSQQFPQQDKDILERTRHLDAQEYSNLTEVKMDLSVIESHITFHNEPESKEVLYKIQESQIIRGMDEQ